MFICIQPCYIQTVLWIIEHHLTKTYFNSEKNILVSSHTCINFFFKFQLEGKDQEILFLRSQVQTFEGKLRDTERMTMMESSLQNQKWEEFEKLAEGMRSLSHTMSHAGPTSRIQQY
jgi:hypothetical protein